MLFFNIVKVIPINTLRLFVNIKVCCMFDFFYIVNAQTFFFLVVMLTANKNVYMQLILLNYTDSSS